MINEQVRYCTVGKEKQFFLYKGKAQPFKAGAKTVLEMFKKKNAQFLPEEKVYCVTERISLGAQSALGLDTILSSNFSALLTKLKYVEIVVEKCLNMLWQFDKKN